MQGVRNIALAAKEAGVERFIHVSAMCANPDSKSEYSRSKAAGEAVRNTASMPDVVHVISC